jgi:hypothetical protein
MWFRTLFGSVRPGDLNQPAQPARPGSPRRQSATCRFTVEALETRLVPASLSISDFSLLEGNAGNRSALVTVSLSNRNNQPVTVDYSTANGTAFAGSDYQAVSGRLTFNKGVTSRTISVPIIGDAIPELDEAFYINLRNPRRATIADGQGAVTIVNDDAYISIDDVALEEGNSATTNFAFTVSLSVAIGLPVTVSYGTADDSATAGSNYQATSGSLTIPAGQTSGTVTVLVNGDVGSEPDENFVVNLSSPINGTIAKGQGVGTIVDDEPHIRVLGMDAVREGDAGTTELICTVVLSTSSPVTVTVDYATADDTATTADNDYVPASGTVTFTPGETSRTITLLVRGDLAVEHDEYFSVNLSNPTNAQLIDTWATATIQSDDNAVLHISSAWESEPDPYEGGYTYLVFTVWLSIPSEETVTVDFSTVDYSATAGVDYLYQGGTLTFTPGETSQSIVVTVLSDFDWEWDETFDVVLSNPSSNALIQPGWGVGTGTIFDYYY